MPSSLTTLEAGFVREAESVEGESMVAGLVVVIP